MWANQDAGDFSFALQLVGEGPGEPRARVQQVRRDTAVHVWMGAGGGKGGLRNSGGSRRTGPMHSRRGNPVICEGTDEHARTGAAVVRRQLLGEPATSDRAMSDGGADNENIPPTAWRSKREGPTQPLATVGTNIKRARGSPTAKMSSAAQVAAGAFPAPMHDLNFRMCDVAIVH